MREFFRIACCWCGTCSAETRKDGGTCQGRGQSQESAASTGRGLLPAGLCPCAVGERHAGRPRSEPLAPESSPCRVPGLCQLGPAAPTVVLSSTVPPAYRPIFGSIPVQGSPGKSSSAPREALVARTAWRLLLEVLVQGGMARGTHPEAALRALSEILPDPALMWATAGVSLRAVPQFLLLLGTSLFCGYLLSLLSFLP